MTPSNPKARLGTGRAALFIAASLAALSLNAQSASAATARDEASAPDPFEKINRVFFYANGVLDFLVIRPAASTYKRLTPRPIRTGLHNAFSNMSEPVVLLNDALQGHGKKAIKTFGRFAENSTLGVLGLFDVASQSGLPFHDNDFGITLAHWGVKSGPYIFIPILGPATLRDGFGDLGNIGLSPFTYVRFPHSEAVYVGRTVATGLDQRMASDKDIKTIVATATDDYASIRSYFLQNREADIVGGKKGDITNLPDFGEPDAAKPASPGLPAPDAPVAPSPAAPDASRSSPSTPDTPTPGAPTAAPPAPAPPTPSPS
jgi:phospholipid-binding lipoprotein MlaA